MVTTPPSADDDITLNDIEGVLSWWRLAGVDSTFAEQPQNWLAAPKRPEPKATPPARQRADRIRPARRASNLPLADDAVPFDPAALPTEFAAFQEWFAGDSPLARRSLHPIKRPQGPMDAEVMFLIEHPPRNAGDALLSPEEQRLVAGMLRAMRIEREALYLASALPAFEPIPDWAALDEAGMCDILRRHTSLATPQRMIVFSRAIARRLSDHSEGIQRVFDCGTLNCSDNAPPTAFMAAPSLEELLHSPARRRSFWRAWLNWTRE